MAKHAHRQLRSLQKALYDKAYREAHRLVEGHSKSILQYSQKFEASLPKSFTQLSQADFMSVINTARIILFGDFHTLKQTQKGLIRLARDLLQKQERIVLALETFCAKDQATLDKYMQGLISEERFLNDVSYNRDWGFPWQNYKMILDFAREKKIPVFGVNSDEAGRDTLKHRDEFTSKKLGDICRNYPDSRVLCLIGEYHLADEHLPSEIELMSRATKLTVPCVRVVTNVDRYYFDLHPDFEDVPTEEYLQMRDNFLCILNSPPWMKWQSYAIWEEMRTAAERFDAFESRGSDDEDAYTEDTFDIDFQFLSLTKTLAGFLKIAVPDAELMKFQILTGLQDVDFSTELTAMGYSAAEAKRVLEHTSRHGVHFLGSSNTVLLSTISLNNLSEAAGQFLSHVLTKTSQKAGDDVEVFFRRVWTSLVGFLASKILNPRRKCMGIVEYRTFLEENEGRRLLGSLQVRRDVARAVLKHHEWIEGRIQSDKSLARFPKSLIKSDRMMNYEISHAIGQLLAIGLYTKVMTGQVPPEQFSHTFSERLWNLDLLWERLSTLYLLVEK